MCVFPLLFNYYIDVLASAKAISISDFDVLHVLANDHSATKVTLCRKRDTLQMYTLKMSRNRIQPIGSERAVLEITNSLNAPFLPRMYWSFQDDEHLYIVTVRNRPDYAPVVC
jgi:hypothetical protein